MITTVSPQSQNISTVDALWVLIQSQTKAVRKALTERLLAERSQAKAQQLFAKEQTMKVTFDYLPELVQRKKIKKS